MTSITYPNYGTNGDVYSYIYDILNQKQVTTEEVVSRFNVDEEAIKQLIEASLEENTSLISMKIQGARILDDGSADIYVMAELFYEGADEYNNIYTYSTADGQVHAYDGQNLCDPAGLDKLDPLLSYARTAQ